MHVLAEAHTMAGVEWSSMLHEVKASKMKASISLARLSIDKPHLDSGANFPCCGLNDLRMVYVSDDQTVELQIADGTSERQRLGVCAISFVLREDGAPVHSRSSPPDSKRWVRVPCVVPSGNNAGYILPLEYLAGVTICRGHMTYERNHQDAVLNANGDRDVNIHLSFASDKLTYLSAAEVLSVPKETKALPWMTDWTPQQANVVAWDEQEEACISHKLFR